MKKVVVIVTRGSLNHLVQVATLLMAATVAEAVVRVLFRDEAVLSVTKTGARQLRFSDGVGDRAEVARARLAQQELHDLPTLLQTIKGHGDVRLMVCSSSLALYGVAKEELLPEIDGIQGLAAFFIDELSTADHVLTF